MKAADLFKIRTDQHVTVVGANGTGKSHGAMLLMRAQAKPFVIFDSKHSNTVAKFADRIITDPDDLDTIGKYPHAENEKVAFRPAWDASPEQLRDLANKIAKWCYLRGKIGFYVDEMTDICKNAQDVPNYVYGLSTKGRERESTLWATSQRPSGVPLVLFTEAAHYFVFQLRLIEDRDRIAKACEHPIQPRIQALKPREFIYVNAVEGRVLPERTGSYTFAATH